MDDEARVAAGADAAHSFLSERRQHLPLAGRPRPGLLIAEGDSWFDYPGRDILSVLEDKYGWDIESVADSGDNLESMAYDRGQWEPLARTFERVHRWDITPAGILLSGGGNDFAGPELAMLLEHAGTGHGGINAIITDELVERRMRAAWAHLLGFTKQLAQDTFGAPIPTVIHGYDYAIPDGRGFLGGAGRLPGPWLAPSYARKGIGSKTPEGTQIRAAITRELVDRYNAMLSSIVSTPGLEHVTFVDLRGVLSSPDYKDDWANEMHPTPSGFSRVATKLHEVLR